MIAVNKISTFNKLFEVVLIHTTFIKQQYFTAEVLRLGTFGEDTNFRMMKRPVQDRKKPHREITLLANFFKIDNNDDVMIHKYDVTFEPDGCPKKVCFELFKKVKSMYNLDDHHIFYDGKKTVYSVNAINGYEKEVYIILLTKNI